MWGGGIGGGCRVGVECRVGRVECRGCGGGCGVEVVGEDLGCGFYSQYLLHW